MGERLGQRIDARVVLEVGVGGEHDFDLFRHRRDEFRQAAAAGAPDPSLEPSVPQIPAVAGPLQRPPDGNGSLQRHREPLEDGVGGSELPGDLDRTMPELAEINLKHNP